MEAFVHAAQIHCDEVSLHFVTVAEITELHRQYFNDPTPTDCISFPMDDPEDIGYRVLGDVFVCPEVARQYVKAHGGDVYRETSLYVIHSLLHLMGYDDIDEEDQRQMRDLEHHYLTLITDQDALLKDES